MDSPGHIDPYGEILLALAAAGVRYAVIGTWALKRHFPVVLRDYAVPDCDVVIDNTEENIGNAVRVLDGEGWAASVWGVPVAEGVELAGKFYIRACKAGLVLDLTYECPSITWKEFEAKLQWDAGIPLAAPVHIVRLKQIKGRPEDFAVLNQLPPIP